jgi:hypothetical protein
LTPTADGGVAGTGVMLIGAWLLFVALAGGHSLPFIVNTAAVGLLLCAASLWRAPAQPMRTLLRTLGPWLFASSLALAHGTPWLLWNNLILAVALAALSFAKDLGRREARSMLTGA